MNATLPEHTTANVPAPRRFGCLHLLLAAAVAAILAAIAAFLVARLIFFPAAFKPVELSAREEQALQVKLDRLDFAAPAAAGANPGAAAEPEAYSEAGADRTIRFTEKEINALLAKNTDLADKLAIADAASGDRFPAAVFPSGSCRYQSNYNASARNCSSASQEPPRMEPP